MHNLLQHLAAHGRTLEEMQSYHNFSLGGSISVNCHGRGLARGTTVDSVAIVLYINIYNTEDGLSGLRSWTDAMLYVISRHGGRFYLPYLL